MARRNTRSSDNHRARLTSSTLASISGQENRNLDTRTGPSLGPGPGPGLDPGSGSGSTSADVMDEDEQFGRFYKYFNPNQDADERRRIKRQSRALERDFQENRDDYLNNDGDHLTNTVVKANDIFRNVRQTEDATSDSRLLVSVSDLGNKKAGRLGLGDSATRVDVDELVSKSITFMRNRHAPHTQNNITVSASRSSQDNQRDEDEDEDEDEGEGEELYGEPLDWAFLGRFACFPHIRRPPVPNFLLGPLSVQKKVRMVTQRRARNANNSNAREVRPEAITKADLSKSDDSGLTKRCAEIYDLLKKHGMAAENDIQAAGFTEMDDLKTPRGREFLKKYRIDLSGNASLFDFVINPNSFGQTVENMFYVSFLIKEGSIGVYFDENELPSVGVSPDPEHATPATDDANSGTSRSKAQQAIFALDYDVWQKLIEAYDIQEPLIPHRGEAATEVGQRGWYT